MKIAICDDNRRDAALLEEILYGHNLAVFYDGRSLLAAREQEFDLYILDIYIENSINGIQLAKEIRSRNRDAPICFLSTSDEFYRRAYDLYDVNYLLKPVNRTELAELVSRVSRRAKKDKNKSLAIKRYGQMMNINYSEILYIASSAHILRLHTKSGVIHEFPGKLNEIEKQVDGNVFCRCHQSFLVNMYRAEALSGRDLVINGEKIPVSQKYYARVKNRYREILFEEVD